MAALTKEKSLYLPANGIALVEFETLTGSIQMVKIHEINFSERIYSHRKGAEAVAKAVDKTFVSGEQQQKLIKMSQELYYYGLSQTEPSETLSKDYFLSIRFVPVGKKAAVECEIYFNRRLEKRGKVREIFDYFMTLEKAASELR